MYMCVCARLCVCLCVWLYLQDTRTEAPTMRLQLNGMNRLHEPWLSGIEHEPFCQNRSGLSREKKKKKLDHEPLRRKQEITFESEAQTLRHNCSGLCDMAHSCVWHDAFVCVTWLIRMCDVTHSYVWHDSFLCDVTCILWLIHLWHVPRYWCIYSYVWHDSFIA